MCYDPVSVTVTSRCSIETVERMELVFCTQAIFCSSSTGGAEIAGVHNAGVDNDGVTDSEFKL